MFPVLLFCSHNLFQYGCYTIFDLPTKIIAFFRMTKSAVISFSFFPETKASGYEEKVG
jgi:hypothetical protein